MTAAASSVVLVTTSLLHRRLECRCWTDDIGTLVLSSCIGSSSSSSSITKSSSISSGSSQTQIQMQQHQHVPDIGTLSVLRRDPTTTAAFVPEPLFSTTTTTTTSTTTSLGGGDDQDNKNRDSQFHPLHRTVRRIRGLAQSLQQRLERFLQNQKEEKKKSYSSSSLVFSNHERNNNEDNHHDPTLSFLQQCEVVFDEFLTIVRSRLLLEKDATATIIINNNNNNNAKTSFVMDPSFAKWLISNLTILETKAAALSNRDNADDEDEDVRNDDSCAVFDLSDDCRYLTFHYHQQQQQQHEGSNQQQQQQQRQQQRHLSLCLDLSLSKTNKEALQEAVMAFFPKGDDDEEEPAVLAQQQSSTNSNNAAAAASAVRHSSSTRNKRRRVDNNNDGPATISVSRSARRRRIGTGETGTSAEEKEDGDCYFMVDLYADFVARANQHAALFDELDDLDQNVRVLDPPPPPSLSCGTSSTTSSSQRRRDKYYSYRHRRIQLGENDSTDSVVLTMSSHQPRALPKRPRFLGGPMAAASWEQEFNRNAPSSWDISCSVRQNLQKCLGGVVLPKPVMMVAAADEQQSTDGGANSRECGICLSEEHSFEDSTTTTTGKGTTVTSPPLLPNLACENPACQRLYHPYCLREWLMSLPSSRESFGRILGQCPYCKQAISASLDVDNDN